MARVRRHVSGLPADFRTQPGVSRYRRALAEGLAGLTGAIPAAVPCVNASSDRTERPAHAANDGADGDRRDNSRNG